MNAAAPQRSMQAEPPPWKARRGCSPPEDTGACTLGAPQRRALRVPALAPKKAMSWPP